MDQVQPSEVDGLSAQLVGTRLVRSQRTWLLIGAMVFSVTLVAGLLFWDADQQGKATLAEFAQEQATLAGGVADDLEHRLLSASRDALLVAEQTLSGQPISPTLREPYLDIRIERFAVPLTASAQLDQGIPVFAPVDAERRVRLLLSPARLLSGLRHLEQSQALALLVSPPQTKEDRFYYTTDGSAVRSELLTQAFAAGLSAIRVPRQESPRFGLPARMALAGLARFDGNALGSWRVVTIKTALHERDRSRRALWRVVLGVLLATGLVLAFGCVALLIQRRELQMEQALRITDLRRQRDERLLRASKAATLGTLALGITHELSTPLGVISGRTEQLMLRLADDARSLRSLQSILDQTNHIGQIIRGFLAMVRGHSPPSQPIPPVAVVDDAVALVEHRFAKSNVRLTTEIVDGLPLICGDLLLLVHALTNVLLNACDACAEGGSVQVQVGTERSYIVFQVLDSGIGISAADVERATEPFFTTKPAEGGTGLGLAIAQEIVKHHRGELALSPRTEGGTCATIHIPIWQGESDVC